MSTDVVVHSTQELPDKKTKRSFPLSGDKLALAFLVLLSVGGIAVTNVARDYGLYYWLSMVPLFALGSLFEGWSNARKEGTPALRILGIQFSHWLASAVAVSLVYYLEASGRISRETAGLMALSTLALATFLSGVYFSWRFCVLGVILGFAVVAAAFVEEYFWIVIPPVFLIGAAVVLWKRRKP